MNSLSRFDFEEIYLNTHQTPRMDTNRGEGEKYSGFKIKARFDREERRH